MARSSVPRDVIITCAVNGGSDAALAENPALPISPAQICEAALEAAEAGAAIVHIHVRDPITGKPSNEFALYAEVMERLRAPATDVLINLTCSMASLVALDVEGGVRLAEGTTLDTPRARVRHALELKPDIATIDCGVFAIGEAIFVGRFSDLREMGRLYAAAGIRPELECFDLAHIETAKRLIAEGEIAAPPFIQICLGTGYGAPDNVAALDGMRAQLPAGAVWAAFGCGVRQLALVPDIVRAGGHVRVGLEDSRVMVDGTLATNGGLVSAAAGMIRELGHRPASVARAREILGLPEPAGHRGGATQRRLAGKRA
jgi:uncharacterized protein (DUF849 family)